MIDAIWRADDGMRVTFEDPEAPAPLEDLRQSLLTELARRVPWHGEHMTKNDWDAMVYASLKLNGDIRVVPGLDPGTRVVLGVKSGRPSMDEALQMIEFMRAFAAERGVILGDR